MILKFAVSKIARDQNKIGKEQNGNFTVSHRNSNSYKKSNNQNHTSKKTWELLTL